MTHLSATITLTLYCNNDYTVSQVTTPTDPQFVPHEDTTVGYILPAYTHP
jgi:hypothetical protein